MRIYTIGFTQKSAERFFGLLTSHGILRLIDIRLHPNSQLAGFAKQDDLAYFLRRLVGCEYHYFDFLAPSEEIFRDYRKDKNWAKFEQRYRRLIDERAMVQRLDPSFFTEKPCCLLCSEHLPDKCHRRLLADRLAQTWPDVEIVHLI
jgi:uncharacterized protein (DUF488 family)